MKTLLLAILMACETANAQTGVTLTWLSSTAGFCDSTPVQGPDGKFYGTSLGGAGLYSNGIVFAAVTNTEPPDVYNGYPYIPSVLCTFTPATGEQPNAGVIFGPTGLLFGSTTLGGNSNSLFRAGMGTLFSVSTNIGLVGATFTLVHRFGSVTNSLGQPLDGATPRAPLLMGSDNYLYGTTWQGGSNGYSTNELGYGTVFKTTTNGSIFLSLHSLTGADGANPTGLTFGPDGNLYGVASFGGSNTTVVETNGKIGFGTIYTITTNGQAAILYSFGAATNNSGGALDGSQPNTLLLASNGLFYGTTMFGGSNTVISTTNHDIGYGTFFSISANGTLQTLYSFGSVTNSKGFPLDGGIPSGPLIQGLDGNFYGTTQIGGSTNTGTVFRMTPSGQLTTLWSFGTNLAQLPPAFRGWFSPRAGVITAIDKTLVGTLYTGGELNTTNGALFRLGPAAPSLAITNPFHIQSFTIAAGATNVFSIAVSSIYQTALQWEFDNADLTDGGNISGSTTSNLTITGAALSDAGTYTLVASNFAGTAVTSEQLTVLAAVILKNPLGATIPAGLTTNLNVSVQSVYPATYQWLYNGFNLSDGGNISGSLTTNLIITNATIANSGTYSLLINNSVGSVQTIPAILNVEPLVVISPPESQTALAGVVLTIFESVQSDFPTTYQWQLNGANISDGIEFSGSSTTNLTITAAMDDAGTYSIIASNAVGAATNYATLSVSPFIIIASPVNATVLAGPAQTFSIAVESIFPMSYQWQLNGAPLSDNGRISGSSTAQLTISNLTSADSGTYTVTAWNSAGTNTSPAFLQVIVPYATGVTFTNLYSFTNGFDGGEPLAALLQGADGVFYGTALNGGAGGGGIIFRFATNGGFSVLYSFGSHASDGANPFAALIQDAAGTLYGTTYNDGQNSEGTVFSLATNRTLTNLVSFGVGQGYAQAGLVQDGPGIFYGGTLDGSLFSITSNATYTLLDKLPGNSGITSTFVLASDGNLYAPAYSGGNEDGTIVQLQTNGSVNVLYSFAGGTNGQGPDASLVQTADGTLYGTTIIGGAHGEGIVYSITTNGAFSIIYNFGSLTNTNGDLLDGAEPLGLTVGTDHWLYGVTSWGGYQNKGTVYRINTSGQLETLVYFDSNNGSYPWGGVIQASDGNFYGTTEDGGPANAGVIFELSAPQQSPQIRSISLINQTVSFSVAAIPGESYQVQYSPSLAPPLWQNLGSPTNASASTLTITDTLNQSQRFYRIILLPSP